MATCHKLRMIKAARCYALMSFRIALRFCALTPLIVPENEIIFKNKETPCGRQETGDGEPSPVSEPSL